MNIADSLFSAFRSVYGHKMRSILTMLGIIIGVGSVIMIISVGEGVSNSVFQTLNSIDKRVIQVYARGAQSMEDLLNFGDAEAIKKIPGVEKVTSSGEWWGLKLKTRRADHFEEGSLFGSDADYGILEKVEIRHGRFISDNDVENALKVAVIRPQIAFEVFGYINCVGEKIEVEYWNGTEEFTVIGVLDGDLNASVIEENLTTPLKRSIAVIPVTTINEMFNYGENVDWMAVSVDKKHNTTDVARAITGLLDRRHNNEDAYYAESMESDFEMIGTVLAGVTGFVAFVAAISLFVGGVGIMNIMLVSVKERTREIGVRKSLGATEGNIQLQFLIESVTLSLIGGIIGIVLGLSLASICGQVLSNMMRMEVIPAISPGAIIILSAISSLVGIVFGVYPAGKAAKLDPIEALRYE